MNVRHKIIAGCTAAVTITGGVTAATIAADATPAAPAVHTIHLISHATGQHPFNRHTSAATGIDRRNGKIVGYDIIHERFTKTHGVITGAVALNGGLLYFRIPVSTGPVLTGKITGGTDNFRGVTGTIRARNLNKAGTRTRVTITYQH